MYKRLFKEKANFHINKSIQEGTQTQYTIIKTTLDLNHVTFIMRSLQFPIDSKNKALLLIELYIECMKKAISEHLMNK